MQTGYSYGKVVGNLFESIMNLFLKLKVFTLSLHRYGYLFIPLLILIGIGFYLLLTMAIKAKLGWQQENFKNKLFRKKNFLEKSLDKKKKETFRQKRLYKS
jgi:hypothetical protein